MITVDPFQLNYSILWICMEVCCDEDGGLLGLLSPSVLHPLVFEAFVLSSQSSCELQIVQHHPW